MVHNPGGDWNPGARGVVPKDARLESPLGTQTTKFTTQCGWNPKPSGCNASKFMVI